MIMALGPYGVLLFGMGAFFFLVGLLQVYTPQLIGFRRRGIIDGAADAPRGSAGPAEKIVGWVVGGLLMLIGGFFLYIWYYGIFVAGI